MKDQIAFRTQAELGEAFGVFDAVPMEFYHSLKNYVSSSALCAAAKSMGHFRAYLEEGIEVTRDMEMGTAIHMGALEPDLFLKYNVLGPEVESRRERAWKGFEDANPGKKCWKPSEWARIQGTIASIRSNPTVVEMLRGARMEQTVLWRDPDSGVLCRCRPDFLTADGIPPDLKTTTDASRQAFASTIAERLYHMRMAFYIDGVNQVLGTSNRHGILIAAEKTAPYPTVPYVLGPDAKYEIDPIEEGRSRYKALLLQIAESRKSGNWPSYPTSFQPISLPGWYIRQTLEGGA